MYFYKNKRYYNAIRDYQNGNGNSCIIIIKELCKINRKNVKFDEEINAFITEIQSIAKEKNDRQMIAYTQQIGNLMKRNDGDTLGYNSALENTISTDHECVIVIENAMQYGEYQVAINNIVEYIAASQSFYAAYLVLKKMDECTIASPALDKNAAVMLFIEKMFVIMTENDVIYSVGGLFSNSYKSYWKGFKEKDFHSYQKIVKKYTDRYSIKDILSQSGEMLYRKSYPLVLSFKYQLETVAKVTVFSIKIENNKYVIDYDYQKYYEHDLMYVGTVYDGTCDDEREESLSEGRNMIKIPSLSRAIEFTAKIDGGWYHKCKVVSQRVNVKLIKLRGRTLVVASKE